MHNHTFHSSRGASVQVARIFDFSLCALCAYCLSLVILLKFIPRCALKIYRVLSCLDSLGNSDPYTCA